MVLTDRDGGEGEKQTTRPLPGRSFLEELALEGMRMATPVFRTIRSVTVKGPGLLGPSCPSLSLACDDSAMSCVLSLGPLCCRKTDNVRIASCQRP